MKLEKALKMLSERIEGVKAASKVTFEENLALASGCNNYGCTCVSYETCCGCMIQ